MRRVTCLALALGGAAALTLSTAGPASAHEIRQVGKYTFTVGYGNEPAYVGQENFVQLFLNDRATGKPVTNVGPSLNVDVEVGTAKKALSLEPSFDPDTGLGRPGEYDAFFFPTTPGKYTFHFSGSIGHQKINQSFTSGPTTFALVEDPTSVEFPNRVPTTADISGLLGREIPRLQSAIADAKGSADSARTVGIIGIVVGGLGLGAAGTALVLRRRS